MPKWWIYALGGTYTPRRRFANPSRPIVFPNAPHWRIARYLLKNPNSTKYSIQKNATQKDGKKETRIRPETLYRAVRELKEWGAIRVSNVGISRANKKMEYYTLTFRGAIWALQSLYSTSDLHHPLMEQISAEYRAMFPGILNQWSHFKSHGAQTERRAALQFELAILDEPASAAAFDPTTKGWLPIKDIIHQDALAAVFRKFIFGGRELPNSLVWEEPWISAIKDSKILLGWAQKLAFSSFDHYYQVCEKWADTLKELEPLPGTLTQDSVEVSVGEMLRDLRKVARRFEIAKREHYIGS